MFHFAVLLLYRTPFKDYLRQNQRRLYRSSQNAALLQYRLPPTGYFMAEIRFHKIHERKKSKSVLLHRKKNLLVEFLS